MAEVANAFGGCDNRHCLYAQFILRKGAILRTAKHPYLRTRNCAKLRTKMCGTPTFFVAGLGYKPRTTKQSNPRTGFGHVFRGACANGFGQCDKHFRRRCKPKSPGRESRRPVLHLHFWKLDWKIPDRAVTLPSKYFKYGLVWLNCNCEIFRNANGFGGCAYANWKLRFFYLKNSFKNEKMIIFCTMCPKRFSPQWQPKLSPPQNRSASLGIAHRSASGWSFLASKQRSNWRFLIRMSQL